MAEPFDPSAYAKLAAAAVGLTIPADDFDSVVGASDVLARVSGPLMQFELPEDIVAAAVFSAPGGDGA